MYNGHRRKINKTRFIIFILAVIVALAAIVFAVYQFGFKHAGPSTSDKKDEPQKPAASVETILKEADFMAAQYNYDAAIEKVKTYGANYADKKELKDAVAKYEKTKATCVKYPDVTTIPHVFFHSLVNDTAKVFDGDAQSGGYNQVMTTIDEFNKIIQQMYDKGYVMVSVHDMAQMVKQADGTSKMTAGSIMLPPGKKPFVMSQDDVCYYEFMTRDGYPTRLIVDENGKVTNELVKADGTVERGAMDLVPILDEFVEKHPDFSYRGRKAILALTGYNGILGYRTSDRVYSVGGKGDVSNPNLEEDKVKAKKVAEAIKADGYEFASHSWGHINNSKVSFDGFKRDADLWQKEVAPLIGGTDVIIFPFGSDIGSWTKYTGEKYDYYKSQGFDYYCNVDGSKTYWVQLTGDYLRQGRMNLDGYKMYQDLAKGKNKLAPFFDVKSVFDPVRPTPVPDM